MREYETTPAIANRLKFKRKQLQVNQSELAAMSGVSQRQISTYELAKSEPRPDTLERLAKALGTTAEWLEFGDEESDIDILTEEHMKDAIGSATHVPILKWDLEIIKRIRIPFIRDMIPVPDVVSDESFALVVRGSGMSPDYPEGSVIVVDPNVELQSGSDVVIEMAGEVDFKRYSVEPSGRRFLVPINPQFPAVAIDDDGFKVLGVVALQLIYRHRPD